MLEFRWLPLAGPSPNFLGPTTLRAPIQKHGSQNSEFPTGDYYLRKPMIYSQLLTRATEAELLGLHIAL
jgi:hypothetical protein